MSSMSGSSGYGQMQSGLGITGNKTPSGYKTAQMQNFTPQMMELFKQLMGDLGPDSFLSKLAGGDQSQFEEMEAPAMRQFQGLQDQIASRFSGQGMGSRRGSGFQNTMNQATSDFAQQLQSNRMNLRQNAIRDLQGMGNSLLQQKPYEQMLVQKQPKPGMDWAGAGQKLLGAGLGFLTGGPPGAAAGSAGGDLVAQASRIRG